MIVEQQKEAAASDQTPPLHVSISETKPRLQKESENKHHQTFKSNMATEILRRHHWLRFCTQVTWWWKLCEQIQTWTFNLNDSVLWLFSPVCWLDVMVEEVTEEALEGMLKRFRGSTLPSSSFVTSSSSPLSPSDEDEDFSSEESAKMALNRSMGGLFSSSSSSSSSSPSPFFFSELCWSTDFICMKRTQVHIFMIMFLLSSR